MKKPYAEPRLIEYGHVAALTLGTTGPQDDSPDEFGREDTGRRRPPRERERDRRRSKSRVKPVARPTRKPSSGTFNK